jgi:hypothetical protein
MAQCHRVLFGLGCIAGESRRNGCGYVRAMGAAGVSHDGVVSEAPSISIGPPLEASPLPGEVTWGWSGVAPHEEGYRFATGSRLGASTMSNNHGGRG